MLRVRPVFPPVDEFAARFAWRGRAVSWGCAVASACVLMLAGCASGPTPVAGRAKPGADRPVAAHNPDRDGAPGDAPPNLATLPDAVPQVEAIRQGGPNKPYVVLGQSYEPASSDVSWKEKGVASWYGTKFHGRRTASGEMFSMYGMTAAHRTLPIPSYARVRNVRTGKEIIVRVNDRGPFHSSRVMDLSYAAAVKLGIVSTGSAPVEIERLTFDEIRTGAWKRGTVMDPDPVMASAVPLSPPPADAPGDDPIAAVAAKVAGQADEAQAGASNAAAQAAASTEAVPMVSSAKDGPSHAYTPFAKGFWVQLAALGRREGVDHLQQRVSTELADLSPMMAVFHEPPYFKLQVGPYASRGEALAAAQQARESLQLTPMVVERR
ncbi:MAG: septal ring lytic transglycosylase RlpA family protein [Aquabacterium sp.]